jgi:hypothetical protein
MRSIATSSSTPSGDDVTLRQRLEVDLVVRSHHPEGLLDAEMQRPAQAPNDVAAKGAQAAGQRAPGLRLALLHGPAGLEGRSVQL